MLRRLIYELHTVNQATLTYIFFIIHFHFAMHESKAKQSNECQRYDRHEQAITFKQRYIS